MPLDAPVTMATLADDLSRVRGKGKFDVIRFTNPQIEIVNDQNNNARYLLRTFVSPRGNHADATPQALATQDSRPTKHRSRIMALVEARNT